MTNPGMTNLGMTATGMRRVDTTATRHHRRRVGPWIVRGLVVITLLGISAWVISHPRATLDLFVTPDQRARWLLEHGHDRAAADLFSDPLWRGIALYRAGDFKNAAISFGRDPGAAGQFDQANALVMQGQYDNAIKLYDALLTKQPDWQAAKDNRTIAAVRAARLQTQGGEADTGETPDAVVYDTGKSDARQQQPADDTTQQVTSDAALRETWLRRVATKPADFLRAKFAFQLSQQQNAAQLSQPVAEPKP
jgi:Ca-activated chloride channel family protein